MRTVAINYNPAIEPDFGLRRAFDKPIDFVRTAAFCSDEFFTNPLREQEYVDEAEYWFADIDIVYVRYVSNDVDYGYNYSRWTHNFTRYVENYFASRICKTLTGTAFSDAQNAELRRVRLEATSTDAQAEPTKSPPPGSWGLSRNGGSYSRWNRTGGAR